MWPLVQTVVPFLGSAHCPAGALETKPVSVTAKICRQFLTEQVAPAIKAKWPDRNRKITMQQDGATSHIEEGGPDFVAAATAGNWTIKLVTQSSQ
jgi:hypothetical protein